MKFRYMVLSLALGVVLMLVTIWVLASPVRTVEASETSAQTLYYVSFYKNYYGCNSALYIQNPGSQPSEIELKFYGSAHKISHSLPSKGSFVLSAADISELNDATVYSLFIQSTTSVESIIKQTCLLSWYGDEVASHKAAEMGSKNQFFGPYHKSWGESEVGSSLALWNIGPLRANVEVEFISADGTSFNDSFSIAAGARHQLSSPMLSWLPPGVRGWMRVTSDEPLVGELDHFDMGGGVFEIDGSLHSSYLPRVFSSVDAEYGVLTSTLLVGNTGGGEASTVVKYYSYDGTEVYTSALTLASGAVTFIDVGAETNLPDGKVFAVKLEGDPAFVLGEMYYEGVGTVFDYRSMLNIQIALPHLAHSTMTRTLFSVLRPVAGVGDIPLSISYYDMTGDLVFRQDTALPPMGWLRQDLGDVPQLGDNFVGSAVISSTENLAVQADMYVRNPCVPISGVEITRTPSGELFAGDTVRFTANVTAQTYDSLSYSWTVDGTPVAASGTVFTHTFGTIGTHTVGVTVRNPCSHADDLITMDVVPSDDGGNPPPVKEGDQLYVAPDGDCGGVSPCYSSVQAAVDAAGSGDEIRVATGVYHDRVIRYAPSGYNGTSVVTQVVYLDKSLTLRGGYTITNWTTPFPVSQPSILYANGQWRVLFISGDITPTIRGLWIAGGNADYQGGHAGSPNNDAGGGVYILNAAPHLSGNVIVDNTISVDQWFAPPHCGAGIYLAHSKATLEDNLVTGNRMHGRGGGICLYRSDASLTDNYITDNEAEWGGGVYIEEGAPVVEENIISHNLASYGAGGGLYLKRDAAIINSNEIISNTVDYGIGGGVMVSESDATLTYNTVTGNSVGGATGDGGGGLSIYSSHGALIGNLIARNSTRETGGGMQLLQSDTLFVNNVILSNQADSAGSCFHIEGGKPRFYHTTFALNHGGDGSCISAETYSSDGTVSAVALTNTILVSHTTGLVVAADNTAELHGVLWFDNDTNTMGPGTITVTNAIIGNPAFSSDGYHLTGASAAIDGGLESSTLLDIDQQLRPWGDAPDLGADEYPTLPESLVLAGSSLAIVKHPQTFQAMVTPVAATQPFTYVWAATGHTTTTTSVGGLTDTRTFTWTTVGPQVVTVTVTNAFGTTLRETHMLRVGYPTYLPIVARN